MVSALLFLEQGEKCAESEAGKLIKSYLERLMQDVQIASPDFGNKNSGITSGRLQSMTVAR